MMSDIPLPPTFGLVLAGGLARRMGGGDKARIKIGHSTIIDRVLATLSGQCVDIIINANGDPKRFEDTGCVVVPDSVPDFAGPLAGILAGLDWLAEQNNGVEWMLSVPGDCPFLPDDLVERLHAGAAQNGRRRAAGLRPLRRMAPSGGRPVAAGAAREFAQGAVEEGLHKIEVWTARHGVAIADWPDQPVDPFFNVNTPEDAARATRIALQHS